jgi:hypothetical protein
MVFRLYEFGVVLQCLYLVFLIEYGFNCLKNEAHAEIPVKFGSFDEELLDVVLIDLFKKPLAEVWIIFHECEDKPVAALDVFFPVATGTPEQHCMKVE